VTLPKGWAAPASAFVLPWADARPLIETRYRQLAGGSEQLDTILNLADELDTTDVILEAPYIDYDYRSEFSQHFARRFRPPPDSNERLIFLDREQSALGYSVIRPTTKPVGRTVMNVPPKRLERYVSCRARQTILAYGHPFEVEGFPFMSQDGEYGRCAHAAIWSIARLQHACHETGRQSIASIVAATGTGQLPDKTAMSSGLTVVEVRQALRMLGLPVLSYTPKRSLGGTTFTEVMCRYLDSGFPIAINTPRHLTVLVGYAREQDTGKVHWIRSNDNTGPYDVVSDFDPDAAEDDLGEWQAALVALPGRIHVPAENAQTAAERAFEKQLGAKGGPARLRKRWDEGKIVGRTYAVKPAELKQSYLEESHVESIARLYLGTPTPVWAWLTEFRYVDDPKGQILGTVMIDATGSKHKPEPVVMDIDGWCVYFDPTGAARGKQRAPSPVRYPSRLPDRKWDPADATAQPADGS
jgi:hypothetical protein